VGLVKGWDIEPAGDGRLILHGQYTVLVDQASQWAVPEAFAAALAEGGVVTAGLDGCLWMYPAAAWKAFVERASPQLLLTQAAAREFARHVFGQAHAVSFDDGSLSKEGKLILPEHLCRAAGIGGELVWVGLVDHFELWSPKRWQAQLARASTATMAGLGI
jgi:MraZ protein